MNFTEWENEEIPAFVLIKWYQLDMEEKFPFDTSVLKITHSWKWLKLITKVTQINAVGNNFQ